jgi:hypothetical protein
MELAAAIAEVAEARGLDAEAIASEAEAIKE